MHADEAQHTEDVLNTIRRGVVDFGILVDYEADVAIARGRLTDICRVKPLGERVELYHYLNIRHADLAKRLEAELTRMQAHGEIEAILAQETRRALSGEN